MKQSLMVDLDDVIVNNTWKDQIEAFLGHELDLSKIEYILEEALESRKQEFYDSLEEYNMYKGATLKENAFETLEKLNEKYNLFIYLLFINIRLFLLMTKPLFLFGEALMIS